VKCGCERFERTVGDGKMRAHMEIYMYLTWLRLT